MCGIVGIASGSNIASKLYKSLLNLEYRGYDSCGIALNTNNSIQIRKDKGNVSDVGNRHHFQDLEGTVGIGHTRWATTGVPNQVNAHPHLSGNKLFALVHNGIINNHNKLRKMLLAKGHHFSSDTDTEIIVHLIEEMYADSGNVEIALRKTTEYLDGTYAFAFITMHDLTSVYCARQESPLIVGLGNGENYIGSDHNAILEYTRRVINIVDGEYVVINKDTATVKRLDNGEVVDHDIGYLDWDPESSKKAGYPHYMLKEIHEQPHVAETVIKINQDQINQLASLIHSSKRVYFIGVGTTFYVAMAAQYYFARLTGRFIATISSDEFPYLAECNSDDLILAFSQSGETYDTLTALRSAKKRGAVTAAIVNVMGSTMTRDVDVSIMQGSGPEICVLSTKAALAQILVALRTSIQLGKINGFLSPEQIECHYSALLDAPSQIRQVINETKGFVNNIARRCSDIENWLFIGRGIYASIAYESALKMKEVTYHHAEGIPGGFMKHGTIALIEEGFGSIFFLPPSEDRELYLHTIANAEEIKARNGFIIGFGFDTSDLFDHQIVLPRLNHMTAPLLLLVIGQLFAYYSAVALGRNVDKPRSLAKSVTVA